MLLAFIFWPFLGFILAVINYNSQAAKKIVFAFIILYGFTFIVNKEYDADRYVQYFEAMATFNFSDYWSSITNIYSGSDTLDLLRLTLAFFISRVTSNPSFLFASFAFVFGYFYLGSINRLYSYKKSEFANVNVSIFILYFIVLIPISEINGFRFWTASWVFFFGVINYIILSDKKYLLVALSAVLVHFSFLSAVAILLMYVALGNRQYLYMAILLFSFAMPNLLSQYIQVSPAELGEGIDTKVSQYTNETYISEIENLSDQSTWFMNWVHPLVSGFLIFALVWIRTFRAKFIASSIQQKLFSFTILFLAFANFMKAMPSGGRFQQIFYLLALTNIILFFVSHKTKPWHFLTILSIAPFLLWVLIKLRVLAVSADFFLFAPTVVLIAAPSHSLIDFLRSLGIL